MCQPPAEPIPLPDLLLQNQATPFFKNVSRSRRLPQRGIGLSEGNKLASLEATLVQNSAQ